MMPAITRIVFATERPLLAVGFREVLLRAGLEDEPSVLDPMELSAAAPAGERWLVLLDGDCLPSWEIVDGIRLRAPASLFVICCGSISPDLVRSAMEHELDGLISTRIPVPDATEALARICAGERQFRFQGKFEPRPPSGSVLSPRERVVLAMVAEGLKNRQIAVALDTSENSVKVHVNRLLRKTGTKRRQELALLAPAILSSADEGPVLPAFDGTWMFGGEPA